MSSRWIIDRLPSPRTVRRYIDPQMGRDEFFETLNERKVRYVILRWFDDLPAWPPDEDMDLLIHDDDLSRVGDLFVCYPQAIPCDVYSVTAISAWNGLPYYPPHMARLILCERILWKNLYHVPSKEHYFLSLVYHVIFHKAEKSGFPISADLGNPPSVSEQPYTRILTKLAEELAIPFQANLTEMYALLRDRRWTPAIGTFRKLAVRSEFLLGLLPEHTRDTGDGELMLFTVREWAVHNSWMDFIIDWLRRRDTFEIIAVKKLDERQQQLASERIRGGTWGRGPYPASGGRPAVFVIVYDHSPTPIEGDRNKECPFVRNGHFFLKEELRHEINKHLLRTQWVNCFHSSDDEIEAWEDLKTISCPELVNYVQKEVQERRGRNRPNDNKTTDQTNLPASAGTQRSRLGNP